VGLASPALYGAEDKQTTDMTVICHSKPASLSSTESSDGGKKLLLTYCNFQGVNTNVIFSNPSSQLYNNVNVYFLSVEV
jgi:hypothetical protein